MLAGLLLGALGSLGCRGEEEPSSTETDGVPAGACGEFSSIDVTITGRVRDTDQQWVAGVDLALEERNWSPGTVHGRSVSDSQGSFSFAASGLPILEDCFGTAIQFWLVGQTDDLSGEKPMNPLIIEAWESGEHAISLGEFPLLLY